MIDFWVQSLVFRQMGLRHEMTDFDFYDIFRGSLDGGVFGGLGRVLLNKSKLPDNVSHKAFRGIDYQMQYSG